MIHRCPHCDIIHLDEEWKTGLCVSCQGPLQEAIQTEPSTEPPPETMPEPSRRPFSAFWLLGSALVVLLIVAALSWHFSQPRNSENTDEHVAKADTKTLPEQKLDQPDQVPQPEVKTQPTPAPVKEPPRPPSDEKQPPEAPSKEKPQLLDKEMAIDFAVEIMTATDILSRKYYRELDEDKLIEWAIRGLFEAAKEKLPPALERSLRKTKPEEGRNHLDLIVGAREMLGPRKELIAPRDADAALQAIFRRLDPYTTLLTPEAMTRLNLAQNGSKVAELGLLVRRLPQSETAEVVTPYKDGPAYKAGLRAGDTITRVRLLDGPDGQPLKAPEEIPPGKLSEEDAECASWGRPGSRVEVTFRQLGSDQLQVVTLVRSKVKKEKVLGFRRKTDDSWDHVLDATKGIYYVRLSDFHGPETARELDLLLKGFTQPKMQGLVLDLRFTGGGLIQTAFDVADVFVPKGLIVEFRSRNLQDGKGRWMSRGKPSHPSVPMVCLINSDTGTCTEVVAAALQDHQRARIVGERTSGKASAQNYFPTNRGTLRVTTSCAHRPNGKPLERFLARENAIDKAGPFVPSPLSDEWGVTPDGGLDVPLSEGERNAVRERFLALSRLSRRSPAEGTVETFRDRQLEKARDALQRDVK